MRCLVVSAHPLENSLCAVMSRRAVSRLLEAGHEVVLEDLCGQGFDPRMTPEERTSYYAGPYRADGVAGQAERLKSAQGIVVVFPTWWFGFPAVLKGWFDRVWAPGLAYDHAQGYGPIRPRLHDLREMLAVTTLGASWWVDRLVLRRPVRRVLKSAIVGTCAPQCRFRMVSQYQSEALTPAQVEGFWVRVQGELDGWAL